MIVFYRVLFVEKAGFTLVSHYSVNSLSSLVTPAKYESFILVDELLC